MTTVLTLTISHMLKVGPGRIVSCVMSFCNTADVGSFIHTVLIGPGIYNYYNTTMVHNHETPKFYPGQYNTDLVADKALRLLDDAMKNSGPFFLTIAPIGPHAQSIAVDGASAPVWTNPVPAARHANLFKNVSIPRTRSFNAARVWPSFPGRLPS